MFTFDFYRSNAATGVTQDLASYGGFTTGGSAFATSGQVTSVTHPFVSGNFGYFVGICIGTNTTLTGVRINYGTP